MIDLSNLDEIILKDTYFADFPVQNCFGVIIRVYLLALVLKQEPFPQTVIPVTPSLC